MKTNYNDLKFHHAASRFLFPRGGARSARMPLRPAGCFEMTRGKATVSRGETNSRLPGVESFLQPPRRAARRHAVRREHETRVARCEFSPAKELAFAPRNLSRAPTARGVNFR